MVYPASRSSLEHLLKLSVLQAWRGLRQIFLFILIFVGLKSLYTHLPVLSLPLEMGLGWVIAAAVIFLFTMSLLRVDGLWKGEPLSLKQTWEKTARCILRVYLVCILMAVAFILIFLLGHWLVFSLLGVSGAVAGMGMMIFVGVPLILLLIFFYFTIPLSALHDVSLLRVFYFSVQFAHRRFMSVIVLYGEAMIMLLILSTHTRHAQWLLHHHLLELSDSVVMCVVLPLWVNLTVLVLHDVQLKPVLPSQ